MSDPVWIETAVVLEIHLEQIAQFGGVPGIREPNSIESALARPRNLFAYENVTDIARLAASYAFGLAKNHAFVDGNKRVAFIAAGMFLRLNGMRLKADQVDATLRFFELAAGTLDEESLADWIQKNSAPLG